LFSMGYTFVFEFLNHYAQKKKSIREDEYLAGIETCKHNLNYYS